jgi:hypothetical protein
MRVSFYPAGKTVRPLGNALSAQTLLLRLLTSLSSFEPLDLFLEPLMSSSSEPSGDSSTAGRLLPYRGSICNTGVSRRPNERFPAGMAASTVSLSHVDPSDRIPLALLQGKHRIFGAKQKDRLGTGDPNVPAKSGSIQAQNVKPVLTLMLCQSAESLQSAREAPENTGAPVGGRLGDFGSGGGFALGWADLRGSRGVREHQLYTRYW